ncbi:hypothetical protein HII13_002310 [Brettanomyces bruxellensis]|uniref:acetyl-CoA C-acyltransferase n=1 Tax=Dekkera bruxellensis TaxID=5007 RepID=A0A7D9CXU5_DEKBR|nr:hypothetical protein HII13_002310 [Brettanomyces bruxellensis]VUG18335.1 POT1 [Brettanomyces bruxellensis]
MQRLQQLERHIRGTKSKKDEVTEKNPDDVVIVAAYRTAITRAGKGKFKNLNSDELLMKLVSAVLLKVKVDPKWIEDVSVGNVLNPGAGVNEHRAAIIAAGVPAEVPFIALNRQCSSGLMAVNDIANKIITGQIDCGLAAGVESMSNNYGPQAAPHISDSVKNASNDAKNCMLPMGTTSENVNSQYGLTRLKQDQFAASSYQKAERAVRLGLFRDEILPITIEDQDEEDEEEDEEEGRQNQQNSNNHNKSKPSVHRQIVVKDDEGPRPNVTAKSLSRLKPAFKKDGTSHAGNSSQISDGAAAVILMRRDMAMKSELPILAKYVATAIVGVPPSIMGVGPAYAIPKLLKKVELSKDDVQVYEINEAFAGQALFSINKVGIPIGKVNPRGGAIALGHPLGCTGARQICTLIRELAPGQIGVTSMCIGGGQGAAGMFVRE